MKNFRGRIMWKKFKGNNYSGRILGRNLNLSDFVFEEGGNAVFFLRTFDQKKKGKCCPLFGRSSNFSSENLVAQIARCNRDVRQIAHPQIFGRSM